MGCTLFVFLLKFGGTTSKFGVALIVDLIISPKIAVDVGAAHVSVLIIQIVRKIPN